jgi:2-polyprenyl-6-methoxyphenol hydroxylase-like FAD-dependent oxidoreductase
MAKALNIAVAGCGPAGMAAALLLARQGHRVTIYERFEAPRAIGSGLMIQPTGLAVLRQLELAEAVAAAGAKVTRLLGIALPSGRTALDVRYEWLRRGESCGYGIHRAALFDILFRAVQTAGIPLQGGRTVIGSEEVAGGRRLLFDNGGRSGCYALVVDAMGAASALAPRAPRPLPFGALWASLDWCGDFAPDILEQRYRRANRMVGVLPIGQLHGRRKAAFFWSLKHAELDAWRTAGLEAWKAEARALWPATAPLLDQIEEPEQLTFALYAHRTAHRPAEPALIHIGDAWHSTSPQLGQGCNMALLDAWALAQAVAEEPHVALALRRAVAQRRSHVQLYQLLSRLFTPAYQSDSSWLPVVRDRLVPPLAQLWPGTRIQAEVVAGPFGGPLKRLGLLG